MHRADAVAPRKTSGVPEVPETLYAKAANGPRIAYQVWGQGPIDLLAVSDAAPPMDLLWEEPGAVHMLDRLGGFSRNIWFDARGFGSSDALTLRGGLSLDAWMDDITTVMEAAGSEKTALVGIGIGGCPAMLYAATYPQRVSALALFNTYARFVSAPDYPCGLAPESIEHYLDAVRETWGTPTTSEVLAPSMATNERWSRWFLRSQRVGVSPGNTTEFMRIVVETNVHQALSSIQAPTLVLHRRGDRYARVEHGRYLADHIPGAIYKELDGDDHTPFAGDTDSFVDEIEEFLTGVRPAERTERVLATVMLTSGTQSFY